MKRKRVAAAALFSLAAGGAWVVWQQNWARIPTAESPASEPDGRVGRRASGRDETESWGRAVDAAKEAFRLHTRRVRSRQFVTIINYELAYTRDRLRVVDATRGWQTVLTTQVSHAGRSGGAVPTRFSNVPGSNLSSRGSFVTAKSPHKSPNWGRALRVHGLDPGVNDNARGRLIIIHAAGWLTHSLGCFMIPDRDNARLIRLIAGGSFVFVHAASRS